MRILILAWFLIQRIGFLFLIMAISIYAFIINDQGKDFILSLLQDADTAYVLPVIACIITWSITLWLSSKLILEIWINWSPMDYHFVDEISFLKTMERVTKLIGVFPFVLFAYAFYSVGAASFEKQIIVIDSLLFLGYIFYRLYSIKPTKGNWPNKEEVTSFLESHVKKPTSTKNIFQMLWYRFQKEYQFVLNFRQPLYYFYLLFFFCAIILIIFCNRTYCISIATFLKPATIVLLGFICITYISTILFKFHDNKKRPLAYLLLIMMVLFSYFNDNTTIQTIKVENNLLARPTIDEHFFNWVKARTIIKKDSIQEIPLILVASQGGGIRGVYWTSQVLEFIQMNNPLMAQNMYAISGVSGGGVGAGFYNAHLYSKQTNTNLPSDSILYNSFSRADYLSPVTASFLFSDNVQKFSPIPINSFERSKTLEDSWAYQFNKTLPLKSSNIFNLSFLQLYQDKNKYNYQMPSLFINGTLAETGQKVITSNLKLDATYFDSDIDFFGVYQKDIAYKSALSLCCRFPLITSGALLKNKDNKSIGHIVDGGYRENTGLQTLFSLLAKLQPQINEFKNQNIIIKPYIIYLKNGEDELANPDRVYKLLHDIRVPFLGLVNVNGSSATAKSIVNTFQLSINPAFSKLDIGFYELSLCKGKSKNINYPLGWYMSNKVADYIDKRVLNINIIDSSLINHFRKHQ